MRVNIQLTTEDLFKEIRYRVFLTGKTQRELAEEMGTTQSTFCNFINGKNPSPRVDILLKYCNFFGIKLFYEADRR